MVARSPDGAIHSRRGGFAMNVVCFGQQNWDVCWTGKQQLMSRLARRGHRVLYVDPDPRAEPDGPPPLAERASAYAPVSTGAGLAEVAPGLFVYAHRDPAGRVAGPLARRARARHRVRSIAGVARRVGALAPVAVALRPDRSWLIDPLHPAARVYYAVDEWTGFSGLSDDARARLRREEERTLADCDLALGVSAALVERFRLIRSNTHLLENGADVEHFGPARLARAPLHPAMAALLDERGESGGGPVLGYVGQIDERLDVGLIAQLAAARPGWRFAFAGRVKGGFDASRLARLPNVSLLGYVPYADLPGVARGFDACLAPYVRSPLTDSCNPLKVFEYLATGRPTVATPVAGLRACRGAVSLAEGAGAWLAALDAALADPSAGREARLAVAAANTWDARADALEGHLHDALASARDSKLSARRARRWASGRRVARSAVRLDDKDASIRRAHRGWLTSARLGPTQRAAYYATRLGGWLYYAGRLAARLARGDRPAVVRDVLVVRRGYLGDLIALLPMLEAVRRRYPQARITLGVQPGAATTAALAAGAGGPVDEVRVLDFIDAPTRRARLAGMAGLFAQGYDLVLSGVWYFLMPEALFAGSPRRVGLYDGHPRQRRLDRAVPIDPNLHEAENNLALAEAIGASADPRQRVPRLRLDEARVAAEGDAAWGAVGLPGVGSAAGARVVAMHPGSKRPTRRWPADRFADLAGRLLLARPDLRVVLTGVPDEADLVASVIAAVPEAVRGRVHDAVGKSSLMGLVGLLDRCAAFVCNDTGTMHVARARGVPLVAVLGPENDRRWGPHPLGPGPAVAVRSEVPCAPCVRWECASLFCLRSTSVDAVLAEVDALLDGATVEEPAGRGAGRSVALPVRRASDDGTADLRPVDRRLTRRSWQALADAGLGPPRVTVVVFAGSRWGDDPRAPAGSRAADGRADWEGVRGRGSPGGPPPSDRSPAAGGTLAEAGGTLAEAVASVRRQDYPSLDVVVVAPAGDGAADLASSAGVRVVRFHPSSGQAGVWSAGLSAARRVAGVAGVDGDDAGYVLPTSPAACAGWDAGKVGRDVAAAFRAHDAEAAGPAGALDARDLHAAAVGRRAYLGAYRAERRAKGLRPGPALPPRPVALGDVTFRRGALERTVAQRLGDAARPSPLDDAPAPPDRRHPPGPASDRVAAYVSAVVATPEPRPAAANPAVAVDS